jgi:hypothetical protein
LVLRKSEESGERRILLRGGGDCGSSFVLTVHTLVAFRFD